MEEQARTAAIKEGVIALAAFAKFKTPQGREYTRRVRIGLRCIIARDYPAALKWINLARVPGFQDYLGLTKGGS